MVFLRMPLIVPVLIVIFSSGVGAQFGWGVYYNPKSICALKGSTVIMGCTYTYPSSQVLEYFWTKYIRIPPLDSEFPNLSADPDYTDRVNYIGNRMHDCNLSLSDVRETDQRIYYFRFRTDKPGKWIGKGGVALSVTGLQVEGPERVMEGDSVTLTCNTSCRLTDSTQFCWYKNGLYESSGANQLYLQKVSKEDAGRYSCSVLDQNLHSPEVTLNVLYGPTNVTVSISPSGGIVEGSSVTLTCSSDGNPPVQNYTWFNESSLVGTGKTFAINNISSVDSGGYKCKASNEHGYKYSDNVTLNVLYPPENISVSISPSGEIVEGGSVTLTCSSDGNPPVDYNWYKESSLVGRAKTFTLKKISSVDSGGYKCRSSNDLGVKYSDTVTLNVLYPPQSVSVSISPSGGIVAGRSVNLTCSSDANPPVQNYTWFRDGGSSPVGFGGSYNAIQSGSYYCVAQNKYGSLKAAPELVTLGPANTVLYAVLGVVLGCGCFFVVGIVVVCVRRKRQNNADNAVNQKQHLPQEHIYENEAVISAAGKTACDLYSTSQGDIYYASIKHPRNAGNSAVKGSSPETDEKVEYASVLHCRDEVVEQTEDGLQYASITFTQSGAPDSSAKPPHEDSTVIYSSVNKT